MSAQTQSTISNTFSPPQFSTLDVIGISISTLLFTIVWVGVFSVFLPDRTNTIFSGGLKQTTSSEHANPELTQLNNNLQLAKTRISDSVHGGVVYLLSFVQTGGSAKGVGDAFGRAVSNESIPPIARVFPDTAVLGAATSEVLIESNVPEEFLKQSYIYINTVSFGLLGQIDKQFEVALSPVT